MPASLPCAFALPSRASARLRMPALGEMLLLWYPRATRTPERAAVFVPAEIERFVDTLDGVSVERDQTRKILEDKTALAVYWRERNRWLDESSACGSLLAQCPHCRQWEAELTPFALAVGLRSPFWPTIDEDQCLAVPALATPLDLPRRAEAPARASRLRFRLPSALLSVESAARGGSFATGSITARKPAFDDELARLRACDSDAFGSWDPGFAGVQALLKLGALLADLDEEAVTLDRLSNIALCDFLFLDNLYYLTHAVPLPDDSPLHVACAHCGDRFSPVR